VHAIRSKPLASIRDVYLYFGQSFTDHQCVEMLIALRGSDGRALKADRSLIDSIVELKADWPKI
jgi:hypothetical protein